ncbi:hypothetical protein BYT27DRAFT_7216826 [Phlegmacium glaucopus]|nr:hypothetical protein BYT27DRAFT_7216826 [Phlegmacium glaucopus]
MEFGQPLDEEDKKVEITHRIKGPLPKSVVHDVEGSQQRTKFDSRNKGRAQQLRVESCGETVTSKFGVNNKWTLRNTLKPWEAIRHWLRAIHTPAAPGGKYMPPSMCGARVDHAPGETVRVSEPRGSDATFHQYLRDLFWRFGVTARIAIGKANGRRYDNVILSLLTDCGLTDWPTLAREGSITLPLLSTGLESRKNYSFPPLSKSKSYRGMITDLWIELSALEKSFGFESGWVGIISFILWWKYHPYQELKITIDPLGMWYPS